MLRRRRTADQTPIQQQIEQRVDEEKQQMSDSLPDATREADQKQSVKFLGDMAKKLFSKKSELTTPQKEALVGAINEIGCELKDSEDEKVARIGQDMVEMTGQDIELETNRQVASRVASFAKKLIIIGERRKMAQENLKQCEEIEEKKLAVAERMVKLAKILKAKKKELTAKQSRLLKAELLKMADEVEEIEKVEDTCVEDTGIQADDDDKVTKQEFTQSFQKTMSKNKKPLKILLKKDDWNTLSAYDIKETTQVKNLTPDMLKRLLTHI